ncbi:MAG TPA: histidine phosphatase family protein [Burkholderiaceae bacterium]|jgi:phosphohistidine phosphatase
MELILWRHAEAEDGEPDHTRALTGKGHKQAAKVAGWLDRNLPNSCKILVSPTKRTVQTVEALERKFKTYSELAPDTTAETILKIANWPNNKEPVLIVGHQPTLGHVASLLLTGIQQEWTIRKGNVWWFSQRERGDITTTYVKAIVSPDLL